MRLVFIYGMPATGKLTVARELSATTGFKLFHNHLAVDLLLPVFEFGSAPFVELREQIWLSVFDHATRSGLPGMIFTFAAERTVRPQFVSGAQRVMANAGGRTEFVELTSPLDEIRRRIAAPSRCEHGKLTSLALFEQLYADGVFGVPEMPAPAVSIDTSTCGPSEAASRIARALNL